MDKKLNKPIIEEFIICLSSCVNEMAASFQRFSVDEVNAWFTRRQVRKLKRKVTLVSLEEIWKASPSELLLLMRSWGPLFVPYLGSDRVTTACICYKAGILIEGDSIWVSHPDFIIVMRSAATLAAGLNILQRPFTNRLLMLYTSVVAADTIINAPYYLGYIRPSESFVARQMYIEIMCRVAPEIKDFSWDGAVTKIVRNIVHPLDLGELHATVWEKYQHLRDPAQQRCHVQQVVEKMAWSNVIGFDSILRAAIMNVNSPLVFNPVLVIKQLLKINMAYLEFKDSRAQYVFIHAFYELLALVNIPQMKAQLDAYIEKRGFTAIFSDIPIKITGDLCPMINDLGGITGEHVGVLIGQYAGGRRPTIEQIISRV
ncbi:MAG: hypothetical protein Hyperionvirus4_67 [Hyperionvirus sp.]|uniref:Uncharacterized protein n=1 Tax=Hyperionvirus sp. TaxID=2487770 RepID=A0A3G5A7T8_9VIRU|nr:MAG: hypothetical protein Hyperionvirus4_67 [Hyperionvirus sp.]